MRKQLLQLSHYLCSLNSNIVGVSTEPRLCSNREPLFPDRYCSQLYREASGGREQHAPNVLTSKALEGTWMVCACVCQPRAAHFVLVAKVRKKPEIQHSHIYEPFNSLVKAWCLCGEQIGTVLEWPIEQSNTCKTGDDYSVKPFLY